MKSLTTTIFLLIAFVVSTAAQQKGLPRFEDYPVRESFTGKTAPLKLTGASARKYRSALRESAKAGVNFAGHYIVAEWGCGTDCHSFAIIDAKTGDVYFSKAVSFIGGQLRQTEEDRLKYRKDSRLFIAAGARNDEETGKFFYEWKNNRLQLIRKTELPLEKPDGK